MSAVDSLLDPPASALISVRHVTRFAYSEPVVEGFTEVRNVAKVEVKVETRHRLQLLFDPEHNLEERIVKEQFVT